MSLLQPLRHVARQVEPPLELADDLPHDVRRAAHPQLRLQLVAVGQHRGREPDAELLHRLRRRGGIGARLGRVGPLGGRRLLGQAPRSGAPSAPGRYRRMLTRLSATSFFSPRAWRRAAGTSSGTAPAPRAGRSVAWTASAHRPSRPGTRAGSSVSLTVNCRRFLVLLVVSLTPFLRCRLWSPSGCSIHPQKEVRQILRDGQDGPDRERLTLIRPVPHPEVMASRAGSKGWRSESPGRQSTSGRGRGGPPCSGQGASRLERASRSAWTQKYPW